MSEQKNAIPVRILRRVIAAMDLASKDRGLPLAQRQELAGCTGALSAWMSDEEHAATIERV